MKVKKGIEKERGFTLIEFLVSLLLSFIIVGAIYSVYRLQTRSAKIQERRLEVQESGRAALDLMVREVRNAGYAPTGAACAGVVVADAQAFQFRLDANADGDCIDTDEDITYSFSATGCTQGLGNITRKDGSNADQPITDCNVPSGTTKFSFAYYPQDSSTAYSTPVAAGNLGAIQRVLIALTVQSKNPDPEFGGSLTATMTANVDLRNRGLPQ